MIILQATALSLPRRLDRTDFTLAAGELTCLIGPNGSGKTSLLHALARIGRPEGKVEVAGEDLDRLGPEQRARVAAYLPASRDIAWPLLARDVIALGVAGGRNVDFDALLEALDVRDLAGRRVDRLSTGERGRVLLARALVAHPKVLLLDEPTANLDPLWQIRMMERLRADARDQARAALVALHDLDLAARYADRIVVMQDKRVVADGLAADILDSPVIPRTFGVRRGKDGWEPA